MGRLGAEQEARHKEVRQAFDARVTPEVYVMEVPHDESTSFGIKGEHDADCARTLEDQSSDRIKAEDTDEHVMTMHIEMCEKSGVIPWRKDMTSRATCSRVRCQTQ